MELYTPQELGNGKLVGVFDSGTQEWHEARAGGIGGSEIGAILGLSPYASAYSLWAEKTGRIAKAPVNNPSVRFGKAFEIPLLELWQEDNPDYEVFLTGTYRHESYPWAIANPDAIAKNKTTGELLVLEVKTSRMNWDSLPPAYEAQLKWYLWVTGISRGLVIGIAGWNPVEIEVRRNEFEEQVALSMAKKFIDSVEKDSEPEWDGSRVTYEVVRELHPDIEDIEVEIGELGVGLVSAQIAFDKAEANLNAYKSATISAMGKAKHATVTLDDMPTRRVATRQARGSGVPWLVVRKS